MESFFVGGTFGETSFRRTFLGGSLPKEVFYWVSSQKEKFSSKVFPEFHAKNNRSCNENLCGIIASINRFF